MKNKRKRPNRKPKNRKHYLSIGLILVTALVLGVAGLASWLPRKEEARAQEEEQENTVPDAVTGTADGAAGSMEGSTAEGGEER